MSLQEKTPLTLKNWPLFSQQTISLCFIVRLKLPSRFIWLFHQGYHGSQLCSGTYEDVPGIDPEGDRRMKNMDIKDQSLPENIERILSLFVKQSTEKYKSHIRSIILFGSYARGDFRMDSDIDIMVLVDYPREEIGDHMSDLSEISFNIGFDNDFIEINPVMQNEDFFNKWIRSYPFYNNVINEGVQLYAG